MIPLLGGALTAGLLGSPHCVGMCGAFATASADRTAEGVAWQLGRFAAYATLGAVVGGVGGSLPVPGPVAAGVAGVFLLWFTLRLAGIAPDLHLPVRFPTRAASALLARRGLLARGGFGALAALLPCGLLWSALAMAAASGGAVAGAAAMAAFWLGTVPLLAGASRGLRLLAAARPWARVALAGAVFASGVWAIGTRAQLAPDPAGDPAACHTP